MNYKVLYRKYRPTNFDELIGQDNTVSLLKECVENDKISHAYIFSGPRGTGKTSSAKIFAKAINCEKPKNGNPCNECEHCKNFQNSSDIYEIDAASNNGVDQVREIIENIKLAPISSKYKVYIIDEVHMLSTSAFNALLLTLEEPPGHVVFILATTDIEDVPITVLSRCQRMEFKKVSTQNIIDLLKTISKKEKIKITDDAIKEIAEYADGGVRDSLSVLDQLSKSAENISQEIVLNTIGAVSNKQIGELIDSLEKNDSSSIINFINNVRNNAADFKSLIKKIIVEIEKRAIAIKLNGKQGRLDYEDYKNISLEIAKLTSSSIVNIDLYSLLELILLDYVDLGNNFISREIIEETNESKSEIVQNIPKKRLGNNILIDVRVNNCFVDASKTYLEKNKSSWKMFCDKTTDKKIKALTSDLDIVLASDKIIILKNEFQDKVDKVNENVSFLESKYNQFVNDTLKIAAITSAKWNEEMEKFKENKKNHIEYTFQEEPQIEVDSEISSIFSETKLEIKEE